MGSIYVPNAFKTFKKPTGTLQVNWANPLTRGLTLLDMFDERVFDLVGKRRRVLNSGAAIVNNKYGAHLKTDGTDDYVSYGYTPPTTSSNMSILTLVRSRGAINAQVVATRLAGDSTAQGYDLLFGAGSNPLSWKFRGAGSLGYGDLCGVIITDSNLWHTFGGVRQEQTGGTDIFAYAQDERGVKYYNTQWVATGGFGTVAHGQPLYVARRNVTYCAADVAFLAYWHGVALSRAQMNSLLANPYQLVKPVGI